MNTILPVSIIIPVYNVEKYLKRCINSVLAQTFTDYECILVDDGSPDSCPDICEEYAKRDSRFKVIHKKNGGLSSARNAGLESAVGDYIYFLDSDDFISSTAIEILFDIATKNNLDMAEGDSVLYYDNGTSKKRDRLDYSKIKNGITIFENQDQIEGFYYNICKRYSSWNKLIKRSLLIENNIRFINGLISEDVLWGLIEVVPKLKCAGFINEVTYYYYKGNKNSITRCYSINHLESYIFIVQELLANKIVYNKLVSVKNSVCANFLYHAIVQLSMLNIEKYSKQKYFIQIKSILKTKSFLAENKNISLLARISSYFVLYNGSTICLLFIKATRLTVKFIKSF